MLFQIHISLLQAELSYSPFACGVSTQAAQLPPSCGLDSMLSASPSTSTDVSARHDALLAFFSRGCAVSNCRPCNGMVRRHAEKGWENRRRFAERVTTVAWDDYTNGSASFDVSSFLIIRWSSARFAFWETLLHFSPIKMVCFLSANKLEEETYNNLQYIRQLLLCNDIKWWLY